MLFADHLDTDAHEASRSSSMPVFTEGEPSVLFPDNFDADAHNAFRPLSCRCLRRMSPPCYFRIISTPTRTRHLIILSVCSCADGVFRIFPGNFDTDKISGLVGMLATRSGYTGTLLPWAHLRRRRQRPRFLVPAIGPERWEPRLTTGRGVLGPSVQAFQRIAGHEGTMWKRALRRSAVRLCPHARPHAGVCVPPRFTQAPGVAKHGDGACRSVAGVQQRERAGARSARAPPGRRPRRVGFCARWHTTCTDRRCWRRLRASASARCVLRHQHA